MKKLVDTCGWIELLTNGKLVKSFAPYLTKNVDLIVPTLVQFELYKWVCREKNAALALEIIGVTESYKIIPLDTNIALYAADLSKEYGLAMADAVIYATSRKNEALLITSDKHFQSLPHVKFFEK
jgi:predicted nucleic acid-binding protein